MDGLEHPLSGDRYELDEQGTITVHRVTEQQGALSGQFDGRGRWLSGQLKVADPTLCVWLASAPARPPGPKTTNRAAEAAS